MTHVGQLSEAQIEQIIQNLDLTHGIRLTPADIDALARASTVDYWTPPGTTMTVCAMTLPNGYTVLGKAACIEPANFNAEIGRKIAYDDARNQLWALEGYRLSQRRALRVQAMG